MKTKRLKTFAMILAGVFVVFAHQQVVAQKAAPVNVTNTTANPVPVSGGVAVTNTPTVDARQSGAWNVGITGTPTVQLDPTANTVKLDSNANTVKLERSRSYQRAEEVIWTGQGQDAWTTNFSNEFEKVSVCVAHTGPSQIQVNVYSFVAGSEHAFYFTRDVFVIGSPNTVCKLYELMGSAFQVQILNTGNNASGLARVGIVVR